MSYWEVVALYWAWASLLAGLCAWLLLAASRARAAASRHRTQVIDGARIAGSEVIVHTVLSDGYAGGFPSDRLVEAMYAQSRRQLGR
jgi:hypothetical protein